MSRQVHSAGQRASGEQVLSSLPGGYKVIFITQAVDTSIIIFTLGKVLLRPYLDSYKVAE